MTIKTILQRMEDLGWVFGTCKHTLGHEGVKINNGYATAYLNDYTFRKDKVACTAAYNKECEEKGVEAYTDS